MHCPFCHHEDTQVIDTRTSEEGDSTRRRRRCSHCDKRSTTYERIELAMPVIVKKMVVGPISSRPSCAAA